jgi:hypothetical protein
MWNSEEPKEHLDSIVTELMSDKSIVKEHGEIECYINKQGHEVMRLLLQGYLDNVASREATVSIVYSESGKYLNYVRRGTGRALTSQFGNVTVTIMSYSQREEPG